MNEHEYEHLLDGWRKRIDAASATEVLQWLEEAEHGAAYHLNKIKYLRSRVQRDMEENGATKAQIGGYEIKIVPGALRYTYNYELVPRILEECSKLGDTHYKIAQSAFQQVYKVDKSKLNRLVGYGGKLEKLLEAFATGERDAPKMEIKKIISD